MRERLSPTCTLAPSALGEGPLLRDGVKKYNFLQLQTYYPIKTFKAHHGWYDI